MALAADPDIRKETWNGYSYQILLTPEAMAWGLGGAMLLSFGLECLFRLIDWVVLGGKRLRQAGRSKAGFARAVMPKSNRSPAQGNRSCAGEGYQSSE